MARKISSLAIAAMMVVAYSSMFATPAQAASQATATSVALSAGSDCTEADLDLGLTTGEVSREYGRSTNLFGTLDEFEQESGLDNENGVFTGYGISVEPEQFDGTIIGSYAYLGTTPPMTATTAEWFVLYECDTEGVSTVLYTCFGDYGTCPQTAAEAVDALLSVAVSTTTPTAGQTIVVTAAGCIPEASAVAAVTLLRDSNLIAQVFPITPNADGTFSVPIVVPTNVPAGTGLVLRTVCGDGDVVFASTDLALTVVDVVPPSETLDTAPTTAPPDSSTRPRFTG